MGCSSIEDRRIEKILYTINYNNEISFCFACQIEIPDSKNLLPVLFIVKNIFANIDKNEYKNMKFTLKSKYSNEDIFTILLGENRIVFSNDYGAII